MTNTSTAKTVGLAATLASSILALGVVWYLGGRVDPIHRRGIHATIAILAIMLLVQVLVFFLKSGL